MGEVDYVGVVNFIALLREAQWTPDGAFEFLCCEMVPGLEAHLPEGTAVSDWGVEREDGLVAVRLRRERLM